MMKKNKKKIKKKMKKKKLIKIFNYLKNTVCVLYIYIILDYIKLC